MLNYFRNYYEEALIIVKLVLRNLEIEPRLK